MGLTDFTFESVRNASARAHCLLSGLKLETAAGWVPVERLAIGMAVQTFDGGLRPIVDLKRVKVGHMLLDFFPQGLTLVPGGALNNCEPFYVSPNQEILLRDAAVMDVTGHSAALIRAEFLEGTRGITRSLPVDDLTIVILAFEEEEIVWANTGTLLACRGLVRSPCFFPRLEPGESLRVGSRLVDDHADSQNVLAA